MARGQTFHSPREQRLWWLTIVLALGLSFLPTRWLRGWTSEIAGVVNFPLRPFQHVASGVRSWMRPMPDPRTGLPEDLRAVLSELDQARTYYKRLELERATLEDRIALLERSTGRSPTGDRTRVVYATIVATHAPSARSEGSLVANVGLRNDIVPGMVATWDDDIVAGVTVDGTGRFSSLIRPVTALTGVQVRFFPPDSRIPLADAASGVMANDGSGGWTTDLTQDKALAVGWIATIDDERWPMAARGLRIGVVESIGPRDDAPLHRRVIVRPLVDPFRVPHVILVDDVSPDDDRRTPIGTAP